MIKKGAPQKWLLFVWKMFQNSFKWILQILLFFLNFTNFKMKDQIDQKSTNFKKADMKS